MGRQMWQMVKFINLKRFKNNIKIIINMTKEKIYIVGHKNPDTDSICSPIAYADYLRKKGREAVAVRTGKINEETRFVLNYFNFKTPRFLANARGKKIILLDHNEKIQSPDNIAEAKILEVIDHHKINFEISEPIYFLVEPLGSTATLIAKKYLVDRTIKITKEIAGILLSAILSDTVVFRSTTTTKEDIEIAKKLAKIAKIKDVEKFGIEIKKKKAVLKGLSAEQILKTDFKIFDFSGKKVGIGQVEICDPNEIRERKTELIKDFEKILKKEKFDLLVLMATDIIKIGTEILAVGQTEYLEKAFGKKIKEHSFYLEGVMSRKKEVVPVLMKVFYKV